MAASVINPGQRNEWEGLDVVLKGISVIKDMFGNKMDEKTKKSLELAEREMALKESQAVSDFSKQYENVAQEKAIPGLKPPRGLETPEGTGYNLRTPQKDPMEMAAKQYDILNKELLLKRNKLAIEKAERETTGQGKKPLKPTDLERFGQGRQAVKQLASLEETVSEFESKLGPIAGRINQFNEYDVDAQTVQAAVNTAKQTIGKYLEGGVLRKEDEEKYARILPKLTDTPDVAKNKMNMIRDLLMQKLNDDLQALTDQGYDITGLEIGQQNNVARQAPVQRQSPSLPFENKAQAAEPFDPAKYLRGN